MNKIYAWMAAAMTLAACSTNDIADLGGNDADNVVNVAATRANTSSNTTKAISSFHLINTTQQEKYNTKYEADYILENNSYTMKNGKAVWYNEDDAPAEGNVFKAFTPLTTAANLASYDRFYIPIYQASPELLAAADWMTATATSTKAAATDGLSLNFEHRNAKLHFDVTVKDDAAALTSEDITVIGNITPYYSADESNKTIEAIVAPVSADEITSSTSRPTLISFRLAGGDEISVPLPTSISQIEAGKQYNFSITVGHYALTISSVSVTDWTAATVTPGKEDEASCADEDIDYITFTAESEQGFTFDKRTQSSGDLEGFEYSVGNGVWTPIPAAGLTGYVSFGGTLGTLRLRGINQSGTTGERIVKFSNNTPVACSGDIRTLIDYTQYKTVDTGSATFCYLFEECTQLTTAPMLPSTELAVSCYAYMFFGCTSLKEAPALPASELANKCYKGMFMDCTALESAPALPAEQLAESCYDGMFFNCTALKSAPALPAEQLADNCYASMFYGCTALTNAPALPATQLAESCYDSMFYGCTALKSAPALPATELAVSCYECMFDGCTALTKAPELKASTLKEACYLCMFNNCSNLSSVTMLAKGKTGVASIGDCLYSWLNNAGTSAQSRMLKLKNEYVYNYIIYMDEYSLLPDIWKSGASGTTIIFEEQ